MLAGEALPVLAAPTEVVETANHYAVISETDAKTAVELKSGVAKSGSLEGKSPKLYKFNFTAPGFFQLEFAKASGTVNSGWKYILYDGSLKKMVESAAITASSKSDIKIWASGTYYLEIVPASNLSKPATNAKYTITYSAVTGQTVNKNYELENNDDAQSANVLTFDKEVYGNMKTASDADWFKFSSAEEGVYELILKPNELTSAASVAEGWNLNVYEAKDTTTPIMSYKNITTGLDGAALTYGKGTYYAVITNSNASAPALDALYDFKVNFIKTTEWESEVNDTKDTADVFPVNTVKKGNLRSATDVDFYKLTTTKTGAFRFTFSSLDGSYDKIGSGWKMKVLSSKGTVLGEYDQITAETVTAAFTYGKGIYYVSVENSNNYAPAQDINYQISMEYIASKYWETENNDTAKKADKIDIKNAYSGNLKSPKDVDWYKFTVNTKNTVNIALTPDGAPAKVGNGWTMTLYKADAKTKVKTLKKIKKEQYFNLKLDPGTYYIKVNATSKTKAPVGVIYQVRAALVNVPKAPVITSIMSPDMGQIRLDWKKVKNVTGYKLYRMDVNGKYTLLATRKSNVCSYIDYDLTSGQAYSYVVTAYKTKNGITGESDFSNVATYFPQ